MTIFLLLLKIIGITILVILGILLFLLVCFVFVPFRYQTKGSFNQQLDFYAKVTWLFHAVTLKYDFSNGKNIILKIFGIPIYDKNKKEEKERENRKRNKKKKRSKDRRKHRNHCKQNKKHNSQSNHEIEQSGTEKKHDSELTENSEKSTNDLEKNTDIKIEAKEKTNQEEKNYVNDKKKNEKSSFPSKIKVFWSFVTDKIKKLWKAIQNIEYTFERMYDKIRSSVQKIHFYKALFEKPETKRAFQKCKYHIFRILKNIRPRKMKINIQFGMEDPVMTADILSVYSIFFPWIGESVMVTPDFEEVKINGVFYIRGYVTVYVLACAVWTYLYDQDIKQFKSCLNKEEF